MVDSISKSRLQNTLECILIMCSAVLLLIWPMRDTIAARNIILFLGALGSIVFWFISFKMVVAKLKMSLKNAVPIMFVAILLGWVLVHYFFFSYDPVSQLKELTSIWLRSLLACIYGLTVGIIINLRGKGFFWIVLALILGFVALFFQYLGLFYSNGNVFQNLLWSSIYWGKVNQILIGSLFIACALGFIDEEYKAFSSKFRVSNRSKVISVLKIAIYLIGIVLILHCYVFEINTRNGVGIAMILFGIFFFKMIIAAVIHKRGRSTKAFAIHLVVASIIFSSAFFFIKKHVEHNSGWQTYYEDVLIAIQVERYTNWQTIPAAPVFTPSGRQIPPNTYERSAWLVVAAKTVIKYPLGYGLINKAFGRLVKLDYPNSGLTLSHSGWLDFGLSFGVVGLSLLLASLLSTLWLSLFSKAAKASTVFWCVLSLLLVYSLVEIIFYHGVEILLFWAAFLPALIWSSKTEIGHPQHPRLSKESY